MKKKHSLEILRALGVLEVEQQANLQGSKASKVLKALFSEPATGSMVVARISGIPFGIFEGFEVRQATGNPALQAGEPPA